MTDSAMHTPFPTGTPWLARALAVSAVLHALAVLVVHVAFAPGAEHKTEIVDVELAPAPPKAEALPEEVAGKRKPAAAQDKAGTVPEPKPEPEPAGLAPVDAGVDAAVADAPAKQKPDAAVDAATDAAADAAVDAAVDAAADAATDAEAEPAAVAASGSGLTDAGAASDAEAAAVAAAGTGSATGSAAGSGSGSAEAGSGSAVESEPAVDGAPTTAGTAANLLAYFPEGHVVSALVRFDRLRGSEWAEATERVLEPLPDYRGLFGAKHAGIADQLDMLAISSPRPRDASATTLVAHTPMTRRQMRDLLASADPIAWSTAKGGLLGKRKSSLANDHRVILSPWKGWFVLAQPDDVGALAAPTRGNPDTLEARGPLPPWLDGIRAIEKEAGDGPRGPALIVTIAADGKRHRLPELGLGLTSLPAPEHATVAVELDAHGWLVRGNIRFASEADAAEFAKAATDVQRRVADSHVLAAVMRSQHVFNAIRGLSLLRTGERVSYSTSVSIADARALLAAVAAMLDEYFGRER